MSSKRQAALADVEDFVEVQHLAVRSVAKTGISRHVHFLPHATAAVRGSSWFELNDSGHSRGVQIGLDILPPDRQKVSRKKIDRDEWSQIDENKGGRNSGDGQPRRTSVHSNRHIQCSELLQSLGAEPFPSNRKYCW